MLTPVRRSIRKTPQKRSVLRNNTPVVVTTPKIISENSPGLRLTPDNGYQPNELAITGTCMQVEETREEDAREMDLHPQENSGLRLAPDNGNQPNELAITATCMLVEDTREGAAREKDPQPQEDEMQCDVQQQEPAVLKSACKPAENKSRKSSGTVTFQSPNPDESTLESAVHEVFSSPVGSTCLDSTGSFQNGAKKSTPQRFSARKCRSRMGTPYYHERPRRKVSTVDENAGHEADSQGRSSSDSDSTDDKGAPRYPGSGLRRSTRKTPSKYRDSTPLETASGQPGKVRGGVHLQFTMANTWQQALIRSSSPN